ncbi:hypothetical protein BDV25DRAFT_161376 [Aspergillus avenaceus]|uniref:C6 transcription factor n=1 Tax=Aspergillus avenaceus TaxID=36643 RepID=A0A5N6TKU6_ASPAV|nr:hypothetical protein BDV25DRAFT_161376 [Aspergillus avenaceus]
MYTILAVGTLHLNRLSPTDRTKQFAETYFWQRAIQLYQTALCGPVTPKNVDSLISSCLFMGIITLCPEDFTPTDSWVLTNDPGAMNWLCLQSGLRCILQLAQPYIKNSIWGPAFSRSHQEEVQVYGQGKEQGREGLDPDLADLCGIDDCTTAATNPYYEPLRMLTAILVLEATLENSAQCTTFMGRLENNFLSLLRMRDPPALVILVQWMGRMCTLSHFQPWVEGRLRAECVAICMFLEQHSDGRIRRLLEFPSRACGYLESSSTSI